MTKREEGRGLGESVKRTNYFNNMMALAYLPYVYVPEYVHDTQREYMRGEVTRVGVNKFLLQGDGRLNEQPYIEDNQAKPSLVKLFRDAGRYEWVREEYCIKGFERSYNGKWYRVTAEIVDDSTPPGNSQAWEEI